MVRGTLRSVQAQSHQDAEHGRRHIKCTAVLDASGKGQNLDVGTSCPAVEQSFAISKSFRGRVLIV